MEKIIVTKEKAKECYCTSCATFTLNKLDGNPFCANGTHKKAKGFGEHNGCNCQGCKVRAEGGFTGVLFCMLEGGEHKVADIKVPKGVRVDVDMTLKPVGDAKAGSTEPGVK